MQLPGPTSAGLTCAGAGTVTLLRWHSCWSLEYCTNIKVEMIFFFCRGFLYKRQTPACFSCGIWGLRAFCLLEDQLGLGRGLFQHPRIGGNTPPGINVDLSAASLRGWCAGKTRTSPPSYFVCAPPECFGELGAVPSFWPA